MNRGLVAGLLVVLGMVVVAPSALAAPSPCPGSFITAINHAAPGSTVTAPAGTCTDNVTVTNTNAFSIVGAPGGTTLEPTTATKPIIQSSADVTFTVSGIAFTGMNGASAVYLTGPTEAATLDGNTFTDNSTTGVGGAVQIFPSGAPTQPTIVEGNTFTGNTSEVGGGAVSLRGAAPFSVLNNTFTGNSVPSGADHPGGGRLITTFATSTAPDDVSGNMFGGTGAVAGNTTGTAGGGAFIELDSGQPLTLDDNEFVDNEVTGKGIAYNARVGGGLTVTIENGSFPVSQAHNLFQGNVVNATEASGQTDVPAGGGGEWLFGVTDHSTDDLFTGNRVAVNDGAPPEGGGLGVQGQQTEGSTAPQPGVFVGANDLFTDNSVAAGGWGGAIYSGFLIPYCSSSCPGTSVTLQDSTVVGNSVDPGSGSEGGAIWGSPSDTLSASNSIIYGNSPAPEIFGYQSATPEFADSDVCNESGGPTVAGPGVICANPDLNPNGTETPGSSTLDEGSNALVPVGLTTDLAGNPRIEANRATCSGPGPAIVDMGAYEATFTPLPPCNARVRIARRLLIDRRGRAKLKLSCPDGYLYCKGTATITTVKRIAGRRLRLGRVRFVIGTGGSDTLAVRLSRTALIKLATLESVKVTIAVSDKDAQRNHAGSSRRTTLKLRKRRQ